MTDNETVKDIHKRSQALVVNFLHETMKLFRSPVPADKRASMSVKPKSALVSAVSEQQDHARLTRTRAENARTLFQKFVEEAVAKGESPAGLEQAFAQQIQISASNWSQLKSSRPIGNKMARQIESHCGVHEHWLDVRHSDDSQVTPGEQQMLALALKAWRSTNSIGRKELKLMLRAVCEKKRL